MMNHGLLLGPALIAAMWKRAFGDVVPLGYVCRAELRSRWFRIHSLPGSKRYPDTDADDRELLRRHNEVATAVLGEGERCVLFAVTFDAQRDLPVIDDTVFEDVPDLAAEEPDEGTWTYVAAASVFWNPTRFDSLIRAVAHEEAGPILFANLGRRTAYAPYDGGADLFVDTPEQVASSKTQWSAWLSPREDGL